MKTEVLIHETLCRNLTDKAFLKEIGVSRKEMEQNLQKQRWKHMAADLAAIGIANKRCNAQDVLAAVKKIIPQLSEEPEEGWLRHCYSYLLAQLFPEMGEPDGAAFYHDGRSWLLQILRSVYSFEREHLPFDPTKDMQFLTDSEVEEKGYTQEYIHMHKLVKSKYVYEFMRIGIDITPFNTLGHISGVHYVAMFAARQLAKAGVPVDLALVSGAAAGHDIGKYGCRKSEEKRIPYLHYYYTDLCYNRFHMPTIGHIAANHSTWDLELENLSVESLLLIYADLRVKSSRDAFSYKQQKLPTKISVYISVVAV